MLQVKNKKTISIVIPFFNESDSTEELLNSLNKVIKKHSNYFFEILFVDDGSNIIHSQKLMEILQKFKKIKLIIFSKNFGKEIALFAGVSNCLNSAAVITIDADLQHPPNLISKFISHWESGAKNVAGQRIKNEDSNFLRAFFSNLFYYLINKFSKVKIQKNSTDFRLIDEKILREIVKLNEVNMTYRRIIDWSGYEQVNVPFIAPKRIHNKSSFNFYSLLNLALNSLISHSDIPLKFILFVGGLMSTFSFIILSWMISYHFLISNSMFTPLAFFVVLNTFLIGIILFSLGLLGIYLGNIHFQVLSRPLYVIKEKINFDN